MRKTRTVTMLPCLLVLATLLCSCASVISEDRAIKISAVHGGKLSLLPESRNPVLVVKSPKGIGRATLQLGKSLPEGMMVEFPGMRQLEFFSLKKNGKALICHGTAEPQLPCTWGNEWPVANMKRYPGGMTINIPAAVFAEPGEWSLEWVDYYRN
ncbi:MAG: hypothetical protein ACRERR_09640 [Moraxellaceae bacterium]